MEMMRILAALGMCSLLAVPRPAIAALESGTLPIANCQSATQTFGQCYDTGFFSDEIVGATDSFIGNFPGANSAAYTFTDAFNNWNAANGNQWQLVNGGYLPVSLGLSAFTISAGTFGGGINPIILSIVGYTPGAGDPSLSQLVWTQALVSNYTATSGGTLATPVVTLDTYSLSQGSAGSGGAFQTACEAIPGQTPGPNNSTPSTIGATASGQAYCDPIYPFLYGTSTNVGPDPFGDGPQGAWPDDAFRGIALLSTVTFDTNSSGAIIDRVLTVYEGIDYGFTLAAPEPGTLLLLAPAAGVVMLYRRRRVRS
jgi:hypothetical protein